MDRYETLYNINLDDLSPYDLIVEADDKNEDDVFQIVNNYLGHRIMPNQDYWIFDDSAETNRKYGCPPYDRNITELLDSGIILVNKPSGPTSHQLTAWARDLLGLNRLGHGGTFRSLCNGLTYSLCGEPLK